MVCVLAYALGPADPWSRALIADVSWTWCALFASICCVLAAQRAEGEERRAWRWLAAGCTSFLLGQLVWDYYELWRRVRPPYPSLADIGYLGIYPCFMVAVQDLLHLQPNRKPDPDVALDAGLVTFTAAALAYEFLLAPVLQSGGGTLAIITSIAWACGSVAVLWVILRQMVRRRGFPIGTAGLLTAGVVVFCATNPLYARLSLLGTFAPGGILDLGWDAGLLLIAAAASLAPGSWRASGEAERGLSSDTTRAIAVLIAVAGIALLAIVGAAGPRDSGVTALWVAVGIIILGARFVFALRAERGYARLLEREVAAQTRSLLDSLAATGAAERNLRLVMEAVPDALVVLDNDGRSLEMNSAARAMFGQAEATSERALFDALDAEGVAIARQNLDAAFLGEVRTFELSFPRQVGRRGTGAVLYAPVRDGERVSKVLALVRDVTDQKRRESQLQQAEKLGAIGQLVSGVAHEINNPAAIISGSAQTMLLDDLKPDHREMAQMIYDEATRIGRITQNLLAFARAGGKERSLIDLNDIIRRTVALRAYHLSTVNVAVTLDLDPAHPKIWSNASELQQLLLNVVINAEQAVLTVEPPRTITVRSRASERDARIEIADNGPGVPLEIRNRVFDPFFTTKPEGVGTGLGLSICYGIVRDHGGRIWVESPEGGRGAKFVIDLPRDPRTQSRPASETRLPGAPERRVHVLLLEDETGLRNAMLQFLTRRGIDATAVADGHEALRSLKQQSFDVIVSDVRMPGMNGRDFLAQLRIDRPELLSRVIFSTGDALEPDTAALIRESGAPTVSKPFDLMTLEKLIRDVAMRSKLG